MIRENRNSKILSINIALFEPKIIINNSNNLYDPRTQRSSSIHRTRT